MSGRVRIRYQRPPDRTEHFDQELLYHDDDVLVTFLDKTPLTRPMLLDGRPALEPDSPAIWFTFPGRMHDIGRFHTAAGAFTGLYANIILPVEMHALNEWSMTDLFLDVWIGSDGTMRILDDDELEAAVHRGWVSPETAVGARDEAAQIVAGWRHGVWPPAIVNEWTIERVSSVRHQPGSAT